MSIESILIMIGFGVLVTISLITFWRVEKFIDSLQEKRKRKTYSKYW